jgi:ParB family chromosome partitioning protein
MSKESSATEIATDKRKKRMGGISSLLNKADRKETINKPTSLTSEIELHLLKPGKYQPRKDFNYDALSELADSIKAQGVMQPIVVRTIQDGFEIIAGERRWRASEIAGLKTIPAVIKEVDDSTALAMAIIENIQREDLDPMEEAASLNRLKEEFNLKNKEVAIAVGKSEKDVSQALGLLRLSEVLTALYQRGTKSAQVLAVLSRCEKTDNKTTKEYVESKDAITYKEALDFQTLLKKRDNEEIDALPSGTISVAPESTDNKSLSELVVNDTLKPVIPTPADSGFGYSTDTKNFIVAVKYNSDEWFLELTRKDDDADYCWISQGSDPVRVLTRDLIILTVQ